MLWWRPGSPEATNAGRSQMKGTWPEIPRKELCEVLLGNTLFQCTNLFESYACSGFVKAGADQTK